ncbi:MAG TPA: prepilin-type N-terminal cleavage/methylation domain-containing protein [Rhodoferax sp.]|jgi:general secretion pathway protein J|nr:prepilin-type N-terminal cleavage/methylation domain-containing protein [Rhodoferax sp.]HNV58066.1 prepilin-type N-terminal cleavage/methylation domain-containing protein [Rhodoferax sp.]
MKMRGFTLIELLVAIGVMALMAGLSWRGIDGMARTQTQLAKRTDQVMTLQAGLAQWAADLDALVQLPNTASLDWDGRALRVTRRSAGSDNDGMLVVAWTRRTIQGQGQWLRWQSLPVTSRGALQSAWIAAAQWAQNPGDAEKRFEVSVVALDDWKVFYYRSDAWTNPLSSDGAPPPPTSNKPPAPDFAVPDGVRLVLTLPASEGIGGVITRDWARISLGGGKS